MGSLAPAMTFKYPRVILSVSAKEVLIPVLPLDTETL